jgi:hypothetical protein
MDLVIGWREFATEFLGETVRLRLRPLKRAAALRLLPFLKGGGEQTDVMRLVAESFELQALAAEIFPGHVKDLDLTVNGVPPTIEDLSEEAVLTPLTGAILAELVKMSFFGKRDEKNCAPPSAG